MIGRLTGRILEKDPTALLVEAAGVGYEVSVPVGVVSAAGACGEPVALYTHQVIREDAHRLYGFLDRVDRDMFRALLKITGVGPKIALGLLSAMPAATLFHAIETRNIDLLTRLPGIGKRTAEQLVVSFPKTGLALTPRESVALGLSLAAQDAIAALVELGNKPKDATQAVRSRQDDLTLSSADLVRLGLKQLAGVG